SQLGMDLEPGTAAAVREQSARISIVSAERVREELVKLILGEQPRRGLELMVDLGIAEHVLPELPALRLESDEHHHHKDVYEHSLTVLDQAIDLESPAGSGGPCESPDLVLRLSALLHDIGKPATRRFEPGGVVTFRFHETVGAKMTAKRMRALTFDKDTTKKVARLVELHLRFHGYADAPWTDSAVRRYVTDAGDLLQHLHRLTRADVTTRNRRKARFLARAYDELEQRIDDLAHQEEVDKIRPDLDGNRIMQIRGSGPAPRSVRPTASSWICGWSTAPWAPNAPRPSCARGGRAARRTTPTCDLRPGAEVRPRSAPAPGRTEALGCRRREDPVVTTPPM